MAHTSKVSRQKAHITATRKRHVTVSTKHPRINPQAQLNAENRQSITKDQGVVNFRQLQSVAKGRARRFL